mgnify:CR=1 FL=1
MKKVFLATLILGVAFYNLTNVSFNADTKDLSLFQLKAAQACDGESHNHDSSCPDYGCDGGNIDNFDNNGNPFPDEQTQCTVNCSMGQHDNHYDDGTGNTQQYSAAQDSFSAGFGIMTWGTITTSYNCDISGHTC